MASPTGCDSALLTAQLFAPSTRQAPLGGGAWWWVHGQNADTPHPRRTTRPAARVRSTSGRAYTIPRVTRSRARSRSSRSRRPHPCACRRLPAPAPTAQRQPLVASTGISRRRGWLDIVAGAAVFVAALAVPLDDPALAVALMLALRGMKIAQSVACYGGSRRSRRFWLSGMLSTPPHRALCLARQASRPVGIWLDLLEAAGAHRHP